MRWDELFDDLEGQFAAAEAAELAAEVADRSRLEVARLRLVDRIAANLGVAITGRLVTGDVLVGAVSAYGPDWLLLTEKSGRLVLVPTHAVLWVTGLGRLSADPSRPAKVESKLDLRYALRRLVRDRGDVLISFTDGTRCTGSLVRVGADFVEVAEPGSLGEASRRLVHTVPLVALAFLRPA
ncbi:MAG: hypothetical protein QOI42_481 [Frankiaceae bacterium]|nr:hypothetical protein [Frankiaceae bacterium]